MKESPFQSNLIIELQELLPGALILKNDPNYIQGIPDLSIFYKKRWAFLECKKSKHEKKQPNQEFYVDMLNEMSFAKFIYPENKEEVLDELQQSFRTRRSSRLSKSKQVSLD